MKSQLSRWKQWIGYPLALALIVVAVWALSQPARAVSQTAASDHIQLYVNGTLVYDNQPEPTPEPTPTPTDTPTPEPVGEVEPHPDAPACDSHDDRAFHTLWGAERGCHYDHLHGDDPHELDYKLGTEIYTYTGGEISAPWQTGSEEGGWENDLKHAGYIWHVRDNIPCPTADPCITAFRAIVHQHTLADAGVRFHSYTFEGQTSDGGYFLLAGHMDFGDLHVPEGTRVVDVEGNHCGSTSNPGTHKQHAIEGGDRAPSNIWYGRSRTNSDITVDRSCGFASLGVSAQDPWIWSTQEAPFQGDYVCYPHPRCRVNATVFRPHLIGVNVVDDFPFVFGGDGRTDFAGWADRYGVPYEDGGGCTEPSVDCVPMVLQGLESGRYRTNDSHTALSYRDYDVYFPDDNGRLQTSGWSQPVD